MVSQSIGLCGYSSPYFFEQYHLFANVRLSNPNTFFQSRFLDVILPEHEKSWLQASDEALRPGNGREL